ncbi:MAG TPA: sugar phosphate isomerase/epimerase family protein [Pirellulaceae bacterium]|nr:sugar phosphate isomerase/epimerase family protein [Pirellulaceae bacterium]
MLQRKIAIQCATLRQPFRQAIDTAARLGADGIEIDLRHDLSVAELSRTAIREIRKLLDDRKLKVASLRFPTRRGYGDPSDLERRVDATKRAMQTAFELGGSFLCNAIGTIPAPEDPAWGVLIPVLHDLARHGQKVGTLLAATTSELTADELKGVLAEMPPGGLLVDLDPAALIGSGERPERIVEVAGDSIVHVRARDAVREAKQRRGTEVQLGRGSVDFPELLGRLEERQYRGYFTLQRDETDDPIGDLADGVEYLKNLWR